MKISRNFERKATTFCHMYGYLAFSALALGLALIAAYFAFGFEVFTVINISMVYILAVIAAFPVCIGLVLVLHFGKYPQYRVERHAGYNPTRLPDVWFNEREDADTYANKWEATNIDATAVVYEIWS